MFDGGCGYIYYRPLTVEKKPEELAMEKAEWGVRHNLDEDPVEFFKTKKDAEKRVQELLKDDDVDKDSIYLFEIGKKFKVNLPKVEYELEEV